MFKTTQKTANIRSMLFDLDNEQSYYLIYEYNNIAEGIINDTFKPLRSFIIAINYYWHKDPVNIAQFKKYWGKDNDNLSEYCTKDHLP